jgi:hypothetical protein
LGGCVTSLVMTTSSSAHLSAACLRFTSCFMAVRKPCNMCTQQTARSETKAARDHQQPLSTSLYAGQAHNSVLPPGYPRVALCVTLIDVSNCRLSAQQTPASPVG